MIAWRLIAASQFRRVAAVRYRAEDGEHTEFAWFRHVAVVCYRAEDREHAEFARFRCGVE